MGGVFKSMSALQKALQAEMRNAMEEIKINSLADAQLNTKSFYAGGMPEVYKRTGKYGNSPNTHEIKGSGDNLSFDIYLDDNYEYYTGGYTTQKVFQEAEIGGSGIVGTPGTWAKTEEDIQHNIEESFGKRFS